MEFGGGRWDGERGGDGGGMEVGVEMEVGWR